MIAFAMHNGDIVIEKEIEMTEGLAQLTQECNFSLMTRRGSWFLDMDEGMAQEEIEVKRVDKERLRYDIIEALRDLSEPVKIEEITISEVTVDRNLAVDLVLRTANNEVLKIDEQEVLEWTNGV